ncbi:inducible metalloproteinase inhibitor protein-like [Glossina fuscipes]|uniref:Inducible metalloproteinase inhibitor protein-like n=1 Tax=Glossina fuscipes TaxID=7396 RepID=A0A9C6DPH5_9MUSC|nr:inducible metalloproteinase inhibitor protein-like [Glossina fuscipes]
MNLSLALLLLALSLSSIVIRGKAMKTCPANEFYTECGDNCQRECSTLNEPCLIRYIRCPDGCYCNKDYARNVNGKCIPISECPK